MPSWETSSIPAAKLATFIVQPPATLGNVLHSRG